MASRRYVIFYDASELALSADQVTAFVKNNKYISQWARPFPGVYLLKSDHDLLELHTSFADIIKPASYIVCEIKDTAKSSINGLLPKGVWEWFSLHNQEETNFEAPE